jgi:hypothetical protein
MVATWEAGLAMLSAAKSSTDFQSLEAQGSLAVKLMSLFERQFATLTKARKPPQTVIVQHEHRHIHVTPGPIGEATIINGQPYEGTTPAAIAPPATPPMPSEAAEIAHPMPVASDVKRSLPHGGLSPGAPSGKRNGSWKHGRYSRESIEVRRAIRALLRDARETLAKLSDD